MKANVASRALSQISAAKKRLIEAKDFHDILSIRDEAESVRRLLKVRGTSFEAQNQAAEVKILAERKLGQALALLQKKANRHSSAPTMVDLGITHNQSSRWQLEATVSEDDFDKHVAEINEAGKELTSISVQKLAKRQPYMNGNGKKKASPFAPSFDTGTVKDLSELDGQKFGTIYADPPWAYTNHATRANVRDEYAGTMTPDEVAAMPVGDYTADDCHLHLWVTKDFVFDGKKVLDAWGFEYKSMFVWVKTQMGIGNYWRVSHELLLLGVRGDAKRFAEHKYKSWMEFPRGEHSAKPEQIRHIIEQVSPGPFLELFGKKEVHGWKVLGNQIGKRLFPA